MNLGRQQKRLELNMRVETQIAELNILYELFIQSGFVKRRKTNEEKVAN